MSLAESPGIAPASTSRSSKNLVDPARLSGSRSVKAHLVMQTTGFGEHGPVPGGPEPNDGPGACSGSVLSSLLTTDGVRAGIGSQGYFPLKGSREKFDKFYKFDGRPRTKTVARFVRIYDIFLRIIHVIMCKYLLGLVIAKYPILGTISALLRNLPSNLSTLSKIHYQSVLILDGVNLGFSPFFV